MCTQSVWGRRAGGDEPARGVGARRALQDAPGRRAAVVGSQLHSILTGRSSCPRKPSEAPPSRSLTVSTVRRLTARLLGCDPAAEPLPECERVCVACVYRVCIGLCVFVSPGPVRVPSNVSREEAPGVPPGGHPPGTGAQAAPGAASRSAVPGVGHTPGQAQPSGARPPRPDPGMDPGFACMHRSLACMHACMSE